jgi:CBS domain-containing protein
MPVIDQVLKEKGYDVWSITPNASIYEALELMAEKEIGALMVVENGALVGVFSERDYARKVILKGKSSHKTRVGELMSKTVTTIDASENIHDCMEAMTQKKIRHLPVMRDGSLIGVISIGDVVKRVIQNQKHLIHFLEDYISGKG